MSIEALLEVDSQIAKIRREAADGHGSQIAQIEICELVDERSKVIPGLVHREIEHPQSHAASTASNTSNRR